MRITNVQNIGNLVVLLVSILHSLTWKATALVKNYSVLNQLVINCTQLLIRKNIFFLKKTIVFFLLLLINDKLTESIYFIHTLVMGSLSHVYLLKWGQYLPRFLILCCYFTWNKSVKYEKRGKYCKVVPRTMW